MSKRNRAITIILLALACGCRSTPTYKEPPPASYTTETHQLKIGEVVTSVQAASVTSDFFKASDVRPFLGRFFVDADHASFDRRVVVLSHELWTGRFASSPEIIGRNIEIDGQQATVVGVAPPGFGFPQATVLWMPKGRGAP